MGFNSVVMILNDAMSDIEKDPNFSKEMINKLLQTNHKGPTDLHAKSKMCSTHAGIAVSTQHADITQVVAIGGNCATVLGNLYDHHKSKEEVLRELAKQMGFRLVRKNPLLN